MRVDDHTGRSALSLMLLMAGSLLMIMFLLIGLAMLGGCKQTVVVPPSPVWTPIPRPAEMPEYRELAQRYNANIQGIEKIWARAKFSAIYYNDKGKLKRQDASDSKVIYRRPSDIALVVGSDAPGVDMVMWAGSNETEYWLFELHGENRLMFGKHENVGKPGTRRLPLPIQPRDLPALMGIMPLNPDAPGFVDWDARNGWYIVDLPMSYLRLSIDPQTYVARSVEILNRERYSVLSAELDGHVNLAVEDQTDKAVLPMQVRVAKPASPESLTLELRDVDLSPGIRKLNNLQFDLEKLRKQFEPEVVDNLDQTIAR